MKPILNIAPRIVALLFWGGPTAVTRFVIPVHIRKAIYRMNFSRARSHIDIERCKVSGPPRTDRDATSAIESIVIVVRIIASVFHVQPDVVFVGPSYPFRLAVQCAVLAYLGNIELNLIATARDRFATKEHSGRYGALLATVTSAMPQIGEALSGFASSMRKGENGPSTEPFAFKTKTVFRFTGHLKPPIRFWNWGRGEWTRLATALPVLT